jgi:hypothetical protein
MQGVGNWWSLQNSLIIKLLLKSSFLPWVPCPAKGLHAEDHSSPNVVSSALDTFPCVTLTLTFYSHVLQLQLLIAFPSLPLPHFSHLMWS